MKLALLMPVLGWILPVLLGPIVYLVAREALNAHRAIDNLPPFVKRIAVVALGGLIAAVLNVLGVAPPVECVALPDVAPECLQALNTPTVVKGVTAALVAFFLHTIKKSNPHT